jgi:hypothetical protein
LKVFKPSRVVGELHRFMQGVQKAFEKNLSLERRIYAKCAKNSRTFQSLKDREVTLFQGGDRWQKIKRFGRNNFVRFTRRKQRIFAKSRRTISIKAVGSGRKHDI